MLHIISRLSWASDAYMSNRIVITKVMFCVCIGNQSPSRNLLNYFFPPCCPFPLVKLLNNFFFFLFLVIYLDYIAGKSSTLAYRWKGSGSVCDSCRFRYWSFLEWCKTFEACTCLQPSCEWASYLTFRACLVYCMIILFKLGTAIHGNQGGGGNKYFYLMFGDNIELDSKF